MQVAKPDVEKAAHWYREECAVRMALVYRARHCPPSYMRAPSCRIVSYPAHTWLLSNAIASALLLCGG